MLKQLFFSFFIVAALFLGVACSSNQEGANQLIETTIHEPQDEAVQPVETETTELIHAATATLTTMPTATSTSTPLPPTETAEPTSTPTLTPTFTPTPKPLTHANFGWEEADTEQRPTFPNEELIKDELFAKFRNSEYFSLERGDIRSVWFTTEDGTTYWQPYFTPQIGDDLFLYTFPLEENEDGNVSLRSDTQALNISAMERLRYQIKLTDVQLLWSESGDKLITAIEKNGAHIWFADEFVGALVSTDEDLSTFGLPPKPEPAPDYIVVTLNSDVDRVFLFAYDKAAAETAGIADPKDGPTHRLVDNEWQEISAADSMAAKPRIAFIAHDDNENGYLYLDENYVNEQSELPLRLRTQGFTAQAVAPAPFLRVQNHSFPYVLATPSWSPDGRLVAFVTEQEGQRFLAVYDTETRETLNLRSIKASEAFRGLLDWSPDGNWIVYNLVSSTGSNGGLRTISYPEGRDYYIGHGCNPKWIEDNNEPIILYNPDCYIDHYETANPDGSESSFTLSAPDQTAHPYKNLFGYFPEKEAILVSRANEETESLDLLLLPVGEDEEVLLTSITNPENERIYILDPMFSPDGRWLVARIDQRQGAIVVNLESQILREEPDWHTLTGWAPDSKAFGLGREIAEIESGERIAIFWGQPAVHRASSFRADRGFDISWIESPKN